MPALKLVAPTQTQGSLLDQEADLARAEQAAAAEEGVVRDEEKGAGETLAKLRSRMSMLEARLSALAVGGSPSPELSGIIANYQSLGQFIGQVATAAAQHVEAERLHAAELRRQAVVERHQAVAATRRALAVQLQDLEAVKAYLDAMDQAAARVERFTAETHAQVQAQMQAQAGAPARPAVPQKASVPAQPAPVPHERRQIPRVRLEVQVSLTSDSNVFTGFSGDVSSGGIFVATYKLLPPGSPIDMAFQLPGQPRVEVKGEVRWIRQADDRNPDQFPGMGIQFREISPEAQRQIASFVTEREPLFYPD